MTNKDLYSGEFFQTMSETIRHPHGMETQNQGGSSKTHSTDPLPVQQPREFNHKPFQLPDTNIEMQHVASIRP